MMFVVVTDRYEKLTARFNLNRAFSLLFRVYPLMDIYPALPRPFVFHTLCLKPIF